MSNKETFDKWFNNLSEQEQDEIISHVIRTKLSISNEGFFSGPTGKTLEEGLFSGPAGSSSRQVCGGCGRPI
ncbi:hypothetical protein [Halomonas sp. TD01]|uniref:hypothetical protein n=1 Tax=Halomonas sp. TD01 TaxID=999141 RepID=UPI000214F4E0|nr:hypothetical protein [Halomonas sp. TD01]EGP20596.1 hypothetical protein GME_05750 [Halomonas sp. TD01]CAH1041722.1 hypothetical protein HPTD01_200 [Halomonas sp. TD01]